MSTGETQAPLSAEEEYIAQCMLTGKSREECKKIWDESHTLPETGEPTADHATLLRQNAMKDVKIRQLQNALREATGIIKAVNQERDAVTEARKYELALEIESESDGRVKHGDLMKETLKDLNIMKKAMDMAQPKDFVSVQKLLEKDSAKKTSRLTVGQWDNDKKEWRT